MRPIKDLVDSVGIENVRESDFEDIFPFAQSLRALKWSVVSGSDPCMEVIYALNIK